MNELMGRRALLGGVLGLGVTSLMATPAVGIAPRVRFTELPRNPLPAETELARAQQQQTSRVERRLAFRNVHTNERVDARFFGAGGYDTQGLAEIEHGLRDWRTGERHPIDRDLLDLLVQVRQRLDVNPQRPFDLISGYRSPQTNNSLRQAGGEHTGVATRSQHMLGKATDIALPGIALERLRQAAMADQRGGVGFYPADGFVHVDTGRVRSW